MAAPPAEVLADLNLLIKAITGFKESQDNFKACYKYSLSHFVHHSYPSVSKSTVKKTLDDLETRFYTHGQFQLSRAIKDQSHQFLSHEKTFKANPECQIEWSLLSFVTSLTSNLSKLQNVPPLLPTCEATQESDGFDWGAYLKEGLPIYTYDDDTLSSVSCSSDDELFTAAESNLSPIKSASEPEEEFEKPTVYRFRHILEEYRKQKNDTFSVGQDIERRGNFAQICWKWKVENGIETLPLSLISEAEFIDVMIHRLMRGGNFDDVSLMTLSFLSQDAFQDILKEIEVYTGPVKELASFIDICATSLEVPVVARAYSSCIQSCLLPYELKLLDLKDTIPCLHKLMNSLKQVTPYISGLCAMHSKCTSHFRNEPPWLTSLRILSCLHAGMLEHHRADLRLVFLGMFLGCWSVFGDMIDTMLTSSFPVDLHKELFIFRDVDEKEGSCCYQGHQFGSVLENVPLFVRYIVEKVEESAIPLSLVFLKHRFVSLKTLPMMNHSIFYALKEAFYKEDQCEPPDEEITNEFYVITKVISSDVNLQPEALHLDFQQIPRWLPKDARNMLAVRKVIENTIGRVVTAQLDAVRDLAICILVEEYQVDRHLALLRNLLLINDASLLLPFTHVLFHEESCWSNAEYLSLLLRECVAADYPDLAEDLTVVIAPPSSGLTPNNIIQAIDGITVEYKVAYPVSLVITPDTLTKYNAIFRLLLKLKWAHTLAHLPFPAKGVKMSLAARAVSHRLQILRFSCLADLNVITNYFMAQAAHTLPASCHEYIDIKTLIQDHENLMSKIHSRCMLSDGDHHYDIIFDAILPVCFEIRNCWHLQETNIVARLKKMENIHRCMHTKLVRLMPYLERETYIPLATKIKEETIAATFHYRTLKTEN